MKKLKLSADQVGRLASQYPDQSEWRDKVTFDGTYLHVSDDLATKVEALDPDADLDAIKEAQIIAEYEAECKRKKDLKKKHKKEVNRIDDLVDLLVEQGILK